MPLKTPIGLLWLCDQDDHIAISLPFYQATVTQVLQSKDKYLLVVMGTANKICICLTMLIAHMQARISLPHIFEVVFYDYFNWRNEDRSWTLHKLSRTVVAIAS
jgi:hypothetical protein